MNRSFYIGVDGGATKCIVRVEDEHGRLLGRESSGPANIRISVEKSWQSILTSLEKILASQGLAYGKGDFFHAGMGLAGCEVSEAYQKFLSCAHPFHTLKVTSDAHTACLGAHAGKPGAIIIAGTGLVGFQQEGEKTAKAGGWGFPHDDEGGGAWLGLEAVKIALQCLDGRLPHSPLAERIYQHFNHDYDALVTWANRATSTAFAELAPLVIEEAKTGENTLMKKAALAVERIHDALLAKQSATNPLPCSITGGIADFISPYLSSKLKASLKPCEFTPDAGALFLVKQNRKHHV